MLRDSPMDKQDLKDDPCCPCYSWPEQTKNMIKYMYNLIWATTLDFKPIWLWIAEYKSKDRCAPRRFCCPKHWCLHVWDAFTLYLLLLNDYLIFFASDIIVSQIILLYTLTATTQGKLGLARNFKEFQLIYNNNNNKKPSHYNYYQHHKITKQILLVTLLKIDTFQKDTVTCMPFWGESIRYYNTWQRENQDLKKKRIKRLI